MKSKPLPPPKRILSEGDEEEETEESQEGLEMKDLVEEDKDYYFEDPSNIGAIITRLTGPHNRNVFCHLQSFLAVIFLRLSSQSM